MSNPSFRSSKGEIFSGMMRRPESAKLIREAFTSPLGSTARQKVQKNFKIMSKLHSSYDGAGGPGMFNPMDSSQTIAPDTGPVTISNENSKGMVVFNKIPKPRIIYGKRVQPKVVDGGGGPGSFTNLSASSLAGVQPQTSFGIEGIPTFASGPAIKKTDYSQTSSPFLTGYPSSVTASNAGTAASSSSNPVPSWLYPIFATPFTDPSRLTIPKNVTEAATGTLGKTYPALDNKSFSIDPSGKLVSSAPAYVPLKIPPRPAYVPPPTLKTSPQVGTTTVSGSGVPAPALGSTGGETATTTSSGAQSQTGGVIGGLTSLGNAGKNAVTQSGLNNGVQSVGEAGSFTDRLVNTESGGDYSAMGKVIQGGENAGYRALGKYQIMPNLHFSTIGLDPNNEADVKKFLTTPSLQDALYKKIIEGLATTYNGDEAKVAAAYFGGDRAAQIVGTPAGDDPKNGDGNLTINQYVSRVLGKAPTSSLTSQSLGGDTTETPAATGVVATAADYIKKNLGAGQFVLDTMKTEGGTLNERAAKNKASVWKEYGIEDLKLKETTLKNEVESLPKDQADYIRARDTYLKETDQAIADYMVEMQKNNDMSDPTVKQQMNSHLNYLYTLRGRQNKTYVGYLNDAVTAHQTKLKNTEDTLTQRLAEAETSLNSMNAITQDEYNMRAAALNDMYTTLKSAPAEALQMTILQAQAHEAQYGSATDTAKMMKENSFIQQGGDLKGIVWNKDGYVIPGSGNGTPSVRLLDKINQLGATDPLILPSNIILSYLTGVENYLSAPLSKDEFDGYGITDEKKRQLAAEAISEVGRLTMSEDSQIAAAGREYGDTIKQQFINVFAPDISAKGKAPLIMDAIKKLDRGNKAPPTIDEFTRMVTDKTQDLKDASIAESIYNTYMEFIQSGETPSTAVRALLYPGNSTEERNKAVLFTPSEFSYKLAQIVADDIYSRSL